MDWFAHFNRAISPALRDYFQLIADKPARDLEELLSRLELAEQRARSGPCRDEARPAINPSDASFPSGNSTQPKPWLKAREADGDWLQEFGRRAGPRLREAFGKDLDSTPENIISRIEQLRIAEQSLLKSRLK